MILGILSDSSHNNAHKNVSNLEALIVRTKTPNSPLFKHTMIQPKIHKVPLVPKMM